MNTSLEKLVHLIGREGWLSQFVKAETLASVSYEGTNHPIYSFTIGPSNPTAPLLFVTGGIHGLEKIGSQLAWSFLKTTIDRLIWDKSLQEALQNIRIVVIPLVNPIGYLKNTRSNGNGVDLMRNSPVEALEETPFLLGGHRISNRLPWYRGTDGVVEEELQALISIFNREAIQSRCVVAMDLHSGFGLKDRIWFPFSYTKFPFTDLAQIHAWKYLFEQTHPYHIYQIEPQSHGYLLNGDLWDYLYLRFKELNPTATFLPLTLEMGSWTWVRKNPIQIFSKLGAFNPVKEHRLKRTYRRHVLLFEFILKALRSNEVWSDLDPHRKAKHEQSAKELWYGQ